MLELWSHNNRITSLAVSHYGEILASGDEDGRIKLLVLNPLDEFQLSKNKKKKENAKVFDSNINYKLSKIMHKGPIQSLKFLQAKFVFPHPYDEGKEEGEFNLLAPNSLRLYKSNKANEEIDNADRYEHNDAYFLFASGSTDNFVRIFTAHLSPKLGLQSCDMLMEFKTLSASILTLECLTVNDSLTSSVISSNIKGIRERSNYNYTEQRFYNFPENSSKTNNYSNEEVLGDKISANIFLAAGLSIGVVYVWNLSDKLLFDSFQKYYDRAMGLVDYSAAEQEAFSKENAVQSGSCIHSIIQVTDSPVIHLQMCVENNKEAAYTTTVQSDKAGKVTLTKTALSTWSDNSTKRVLLVACDTESNVKLFFESNRSSVRALFQEANTDTNTSVIVGDEENIVNDFESMKRYEAQKALIATNAMYNEMDGGNSTGLMPCYRNKFGPFLTLSEKQLSKTIVFMGFQRFYHRNFVMKLFDTLEHNLSGAVSAATTVKKISKSSGVGARYIGSLAYCIISDIRYIVKNDFLLKPNTAISVSNDKTKPTEPVAAGEAEVVHQISLFDLLLLVNELGDMPLIDLEKIYNEF